MLFEEQKGLAKKIFVFFDPALINYSKNPERRYSIKWSMLHYDLREYDSPFNYEQLLKSKTGEEYLNQAKKQALSSGPLNQVFIVANGDIGYIPFVAAPERQFAAGQGANPKKGWLKGNDWKDKLILEAGLPHVLNP